MRDALCFFLVLTAGALIGVISAVIFGPLAPCIAFTVAMAVTMTLIWREDAKVLRSTYRRGCVPLQWDSATGLPISDKAAATKRECDTKR